MEHEHLTPELGERIVNDALKLNRALGYDMNTIEFAIRDGVPYAIDFMNPAPDFDIYSLTPHYFEWVVKEMADLTISIAKSGRRMGEHYLWAKAVDAEQKASSRKGHRGRKAPAGAR